MRVAYFSETVPPYTDGVTRTLNQLARRLERDAVGFRVYTGAEPDPALSWRDHVVTQPSLPWALYDYYRLALPIRRALEEDLNRFGPDLIHALNPTPLGIWALNWARRRGVPAVGSFHTDFVSYFPYYGLGMLQGLGWSYLQWFYRRCATTYAPSETTARELRARGLGRVELWARGIDTSQFSPAFRDDVLRARLTASGHPLLLFVGRLVREKNVMEFADAVALLRERGQDVAVAMVGDGPMKKELLERMPHAHLPGFLHGAELARWYASADLFVFPSTTETFGNVVLEAFASGLPVVGAARGGVQDLIRPGRNGALAAPCDAVSLADQVEAIVRNPVYHRQLARGAVETAGAYDWEAVNGGLLASYARHIEARAAA